MNISDGEKPSLQRAGPNLLCSLISLQPCASNGHSSGNHLDF